MLQSEIEPYTAGSPQSLQKWLRCSTRNLAKGLHRFGLKISPPTVARLLKKLGYSLKVNHKTYEAGAGHPQRDNQFKYIEKLRAYFYAQGWPVISCDTKKKELIGNFKNHGKSWVRAPHQVNAHDFESEGVGKAVPYGIYDLRYKRGAVYVGQSGDTAEFAVKALGLWWVESGRYTYPTTRQLLILVDSGGANNCHSRLWKYWLQTALANRYGLSVTVCHYPTGCSKWNPIEHQLFGPISLNWAGQPLTSWDKLLGFICGTTTKSGLVVTAKLIKGEFERGQKVSEQQMAELKIEWGGENAVWNYTLHPFDKVSVKLTELLNRTPS